MSDTDRQLLLELKRERDRYKAVLEEILGRGLNYATQSTLNIVEKALDGRVFPRCCCGAGLHGSAACCCGRHTSEIKDKPNGV